MESPRYQRFDRTAAGLAVAGRSHRGRRRQANEDAFLCQPERGLFAVIDGMGGMAAGQVASGIARQVLAEADGGDLRQHLDRANHRIFERGHDNPEEEGMGCVATAVRVEGGRLEIAHVGDTRALLASRTGCEQLTRDHTVVADLEENLAMTEADASRLEGRHRVTRDLGGGLHEGLDWIDRLEEVRFDPGDLLLLCSDGLSDLVSDGELFGWLDRARSQGMDVGRLGDELIEQALDRGAPDDVTLVLVRRDVMESSTGTEIVRARPEFGAARHGGPSHGAAQNGGTKPRGGPRSALRTPPKPAFRPWIVAVALLAALLFTTLGLGLGLWAPERLGSWLGGPPGHTSAQAVGQSPPGSSPEAPPPSALAASSPFLGPRLELPPGGRLELSAAAFTVAPGEEPTDWELVVGRGAELVLRRIHLGGRPWALRVRLASGARLLLDECSGTLESLDLLGSPEARMEVRGNALILSPPWSREGDGPELDWPAVVQDTPSQDTEETPNPGDAESPDPTGGDHDPFAPAGASAGGGAADSEAADGGPSPSTTAGATPLEATDGEAEGGGTTSPPGNDSPPPPQANTQPADTLPEADSPSTDAPPPPPPPSGGGAL